jgi:hypothetical protein
MWSSSLTRGRLCSLQLLLGLANAVFLGSESRETYDRNLRSQILKTPSTWMARSLYLIFPGTDSPVTPPGIQLSENFLKDDSLKWQQAVIRIAGIGPQKTLCISVLPLCETH